MPTSGHVESGMSVLTDAMRARLDALVASDRVVLFMKGDRTAPRCGFSARVVELLDGHLDSYATVDVLGDMTLREAMKDYAQWPTFPQLWVDGELVGGADIAEQLHGTGELAALLGSQDVALAPSITLTPAAQARIVEVMDGEAGALRLRIDARFHYAFELADGPAPGDVVVTQGEVTLVLDRASARRADGMTMDFVTGPTGSGLVVDNPNEPPGVRQLQVDELAAWRADGRPHALVDVRTDAEWGIAHIDGAVLLDEAGTAWLDQLPRDTAVVFQCHHGGRSQQAAEHFLRQGFRDVYNLAGGIDAWSLRVDPTVPRY